MRKIAAPVTRPIIGPRAATACAIASASDLPEVTSTSRANARPPAFSIWSAVFLAADKFTSATATLAPAEAASTAIAAPIEPPPPVTKTIPRDKSITFIATPSDRWNY